MDSAVADSVSRGSWMPSGAVGDVLGHAGRGDPDGRTDRPGPTENGSVASRSYAGWGDDDAPSCRIGPRPEDSARSVTVPCQPAGPAVSGAGRGLGPPSLTCLVVVFVLYVCLA